VGILDGQQRNGVVVVAVIKPVQPRNVVEILLDEVAQPPQVVVLPPTIRGRRASGYAGLQRYFSIAKKYLALGSTASSTSPSPQSTMPPDD
jgi:hypothetical protein